MINQVILVGRLVKDFALYGKVARSTIAVERNFGKGTDFIDLCAFNKTADYCVKNARKGILVSVVGTWNTYKNSEGVTCHSCAINEFTILEWKNSPQEDEEEPDDLPVAPDEEEEPIDITEDDLPF